MLNRRRILNLLLLFLFVITTSAKLKFVNPPSGTSLINVEETVGVGDAIYTLKAEGGRGKYYFSITPVSNFLGSVEENNGTNEARIILKKKLSVHEVSRFTCQVDNENESDMSIIYLKVLDVNNHDPVFEKDTITTMEIDENYFPPPDGYLFNVSAFDNEDLEENGTKGIIIELKDQDKRLFRTENKVFNDKVTFLVYLNVNQMFDFEEVFIHRLTIIAKDNYGNNISLSSQTTVVINVKDMDDQDPTFIKIPPITKMKENLPEDTSVFIIKAIDGDREINNLITYDIKNGDKNGIFKINSTSGEVVFAKSPDREKLDDGEIGYILEIMASEVLTTGSLGRSVTVDCTVIILDENDEAPIFAVDSYIGYVKENAISNTPVTLRGYEFIAVTDADQSQNANFSLNLLPHEHDGLFIITPDRGISQGFFILRVNDSQNLDYELIGAEPLNITIEAVDNGDPNLNNRTTVMIYVEDENDLYPQFTELQYRCNITENSVENTVVCSVVAYDNDTGDFGTDGIRYSMLGNQNQNPFKIDARDGTIAVMKNDTLDYEKSTEYFLTISARDNLGKGNFNSTEVLVSILDENDNYPTFTMKAYKTSFFENEPEFQTPLIILAVDKDAADNGKVDYKIEKDGQEKFFWLRPVPDEASVELVPYSDLLDYEELCPITPRKCFLNVSVTAFDHGSPVALDTNTTVVVTFYDVNDNMPLFVTDSLSATLNETDEGGTFVAQVHATDADVTKEFNTITYQIISGSDNMFTINSTDGRVTIAKNANLDVDNGVDRYILTVVARDSLDRDNYSSCTINVTINDVNNKPPQFFNAPYETSILENATINEELQFQVEARDNDKDHLLQYSFSVTKAYSPSGGVYTNDTYYNQLFDIDPDTGIMYVRSKLDRETVEKLIVTLVVNDTLTVTGITSATALLTINIDDVNDNAPSFGQTEYIGRILENSPVGTEILPLVTAHDPDLNQKVSFYLEEPSEFVNISENGNLRVISNIDREVIASFNITIVAKDDGYPPLSSTIVYQIIVLDVNDNEPVFHDNATYYASVSEGAEDGSYVFTVNATDADEGDFGTVAYVLSKDQVNFTVDMHTGVISVSGKLDREYLERDPSEMYVIVQAIDSFIIGIGLRHTSTATVTVVVLDVNDNPPIITPQPRNKKCENVLENVNILHEILEISGIDRDAEENGTIIFSMSEDNSDSVKKLFDVKPLNSKTAVLFAKQSLRGYVEDFNVEITARDNGSVVVLNTEKNETFKICVKDVNDNDPFIHYPQDNEIIRVKKNFGLHEKIFEIITTDNDTDEENTRPRFTLTSETDVFKINEDTGVVSLISTLDSDTVKRLYQLSFTVCDSAPDPRCVNGKCRIVVENESDKPPYFKDSEYEVLFTEEIEPGNEEKTLPLVIDERDDLTGLPEEVVKNHTVIPKCFYIVAGNKDRVFTLNRIDGVLRTVKVLDYEIMKIYELYVYVTYECDENKITAVGGNEDVSTLGNSYLKVVVNVVDVNDHGPKFTQNVFGGGIDNQEKPGKNIIVQLNATDIDTKENSDVNYFISSDVQLEQTENIGSELKPNTWFTLNEKSGTIISNYQFTENMKGYIQFDVRVNNTLPLVMAKPNESDFDTARVRIFILRHDQKSSFLIRKTPDGFWLVREAFVKKLSNLTGHTAHVNKVEVYVDPATGDTNPAWCEVFVHYVDDDNKVVEPSQIENMLDVDIDAQAQLSQEFSVFEVKKLVSGEKDDLDVKNLAIYATAGAVVFILCIMLGVYCNRYAHLQRQLKVSQISSYSAGGEKNEKQKQKAELPNTNLHAMDGSNPIYSLEEDYTRLDDTESVKSDDSFVNNEADFTGGKNNGGFAAMLETIFPIDDEKVELENMENFKNDAKNDTHNENFIMMKNPNDSQSSNI